MWRECHRRVRCNRRSCAPGNRICDDLRAIRLSKTLIATPALVVWPAVKINNELPNDTVAVLLQGVFRANTEGAAYHGADGTACGRRQTYPTNTPSPPRSIAPRAC